MSTTGLASRLSMLEERYQALTDASSSEAPGTEGSGSSTSEVTMGNAYLRDTSSRTPSFDPETTLKLKADALDDPWLLRTMGRASRNVMYDFLSIVPRGFYVLYLEGWKSSNENVTASPSLLLHRGFLRRLTMKMKTNGHTLASSTPWFSWQPILCRHFPSRMSLPSQRLAKLSSKCHELHRAWSNCSQPRKRIAVNLWQMLTDCWTISKPNYFLRSGT